MAQLIVNTNLRLGAIPADLPAKLAESLATLLQIDSSRVFICITPNAIMSVGNQPDGSSAVASLTLPDDGPEVESEKLTEILTTLSNELPDIPPRRWVITLNRAPGFVSE